MVDEKTIDMIVREVMSQLAMAEQGRSADQNSMPPSAKAEPLRDIADIEEKRLPLVDFPGDSDELQRMINRTSARIGIGHAGLRLKTKTLLAFRADHACARDSVFLDVSEELIKSLGLFTVQTKCTDKNQYLTRPDLGREFSPETLASLRERCTKAPQVQIYAADGLSSRAVEANLPNLLPLLTDGLKAKGITVGTPFFVKYGRVGTMEHISEALGSQVTCVLLGERPGLGSAESMSAYMAYGAKVGMAEADRTVVSNIYSGGISAVEAGAYLAELIPKLLEQKTSGVNLKK
ncbi:MAG: ethanolamine ammonia-lyase subunit EutC [Angelakisella sp.]